MKHAVFVTFVTQNMTRIEVEASSREEARNKVISSLPACSVESVSAWPIRGERPVGPDVVSLKASPQSVFDSAFGCLV